MKTKVIVLLLILSAVLLSGCLGNEQSNPEKNATPSETATPNETATLNETVTPNETVTSEVNETPNETVTSEVNETPNETVTSEVNETPAASGISTAGVREAPYMIRLVNYKASASSLQIKEGETVAWMNLQENPKRNFTLVSEDSLFDNATLVYKHSFVHTFNETGDYNFYIVGQPRMNVSVSVSAS